MTKRNTLCLLLSVACLILCLMLANYQIERILKLPFSNSLTHINEEFHSPLSVIFFTSGIIWICGSVYQYCTSAYFCNQENEDDDFTEEQNIFQLQFNRINLEKIGSDQKNTQENTQQNIENSQSKHVAFDSLPKIEMLKIIIPNFLQLLCFFYGIVYLSFPKVMIFKILSRLGLPTLYESLFTQEPKRVQKFFINILTFLGFGIFNYSFVDTPNIEKEEKLYKSNILQGYEFVIAMCYLGLMKKIFQKQIISNYGNWSGNAWILTQAKVNCVFAYLLLLCLKQEIYGSVFTVLHREFLLGIFGLTILIFCALQLKKLIANNFIQPLGCFVGILQKNLSLIASFIIFGQGINTGQIFGVCLIAVMSFLYFLLNFQKNEETSIKSQSKNIFHNFEPSDRVFAKSKDISEQDDKKLFNI